MADVDTMLAKLTNSDPDVRFAACTTLAGAAAVDEPIVRALLVLLGDREYGVEYWDRGAGSEPVEVPIARAALWAIEKHAVAHAALLDAAFRDGDAKVRASLVSILPSAEPWVEIFRWFEDPAPGVRLAALVRLDAVALTVRIDRPKGPFYEGQLVPRLEIARLKKVYRALLVALLDPDKDVVIRAERAAPGDRQDGKSPAGMSECYQHAVDTFVTEEPELFARLAERLRDPDKWIAASVATALCWFAKASLTASALAAIADDPTADPIARGAATRAIATLPRHR